MNSIVVEKLTKKFNNFTAVDGISFEVEEGEVFGFLGPNGAGKTTTINMLSTLLKPTSGRAEVAGFDVLTKMNEVRKNIGIVFQDPALDNKLTGAENLEFHAMMYGIGKEARLKKIDEVLEFIELTDKKDILVEKYSGGMKRRLEIARGLIQMPRVLFLDEPTLGLDAQTRRHIWDYIKKLNVEKKVAIILTTHYMEEADYLCDRIAIVDHGKIVALGKPQELKNTLGGDVITLELEEGKDGLIKKIEGTPWIKTVQSHETFLDLTVEQGEKRIPDIVSLAREAGAKINSVGLHKPSLEDVFLHFTGKTIREEEASGGEAHPGFARLMRKR
jgi:ABC-2 type transport system ATP-binding protein